MCRWFGSVANKPVDVSFFLLDASHSLREQAAGRSKVYPLGFRKNLDGWGIAGLAANGPLFNVEKQGRLDVRGKERDEHDYTQSIFKVNPPVNARIVLAHVRKATRGIKTAENAHPFVSPDHRMAFVHNGTLRCKDDVFDMLTPGNKTGLDVAKSTDSEIFFHLILQHHAGSNEDLSNAIQHAINDVQNNYSALNFLLATAEQLYIYSSTTYTSRKDLEYFTLHCVRWHGHGSEFQAVLVASESIPFHDEGIWKPLDFNKLYFIKSDLSTNLPV